MNSVNTLGVVGLLTGTSQIVYADGPAGWDSYGHPMMWGYSMFGGLGMLLFWGLIIAAIVVAIKLALSGGARKPHSRNALDILNERFARGEIDEEEYRRRKRVLDES